MQGREGEGGVQEEAEWGGQELKQEAAMAMVWVIYTTLCWYGF